MFYFKEKPSGMCAGPVVLHSDKRSYSLSNWVNNIIFYRYKITQNDTNQLISQSIKQNS